MRIALVTRRFPPLMGGAEKVLSYLATALAAEGAEITVLTSRLDGLPNEENQNGARVVRLKTSRLRFIGTWLYMNNLRIWLKRNPVDLAYVSMMKHDAYVAVGVGTRLGFRVVLRPEGAGATGDVAWQNWGRGGRVIARRSKRADAFVAISAAVHDELIGAGYDPAKIVDLPNGVPVPVDAWTPREGSQDAPRVTFVGRLAPEKGLHSLVEAWALVRKAFPGARLTLVGEGPERAGLEARVAALGLTEFVTLPGVMSDPASILRSSSLFVLPSREEGMSIALLEAMAMGMPVVASAIPGNRKLVDNGVHGLLAPSDDPAALAAAIVLQCTDFPKAVERGRAARERVIAKYSITAVARAHLELFRGLTRG